MNLNYSKNYLFLTRLDKKCLFVTDNNNHILLEFDDENQLISSKEINEKFREKELGYSLKEIKDRFLNLSRDEDIFNYLVPWDMELERIFNCIRYKYLLSISKSGFDQPSKFLHSSYNRPFQALAGKNVYQGNVEVRKDNDDIFKDMGFKSPEETGVSFEEEINDFNFIIRFLRKYYRNDLPKIYAELIAIKPGMHELLIHGNYFDLTEKHQNNVNKNKINANNVDGKVDYRSEVFALLANVGTVEQSPVQNLNKFPRDINVNSYFTYASCNITEGPFVSRKIKNISYFDEIRKIHSKEEIKNIEDKFDIYYYDKGIDSKEKLEKVLHEAEKFKSFPK
ncbi:hypothetical protein MBCUT_17350 [Methanobrevibacter cuticularis]|uniref:Uncharacterized protein n=1 Tax=Methanobrevibacter cuticularis TaxID=47311 RepID=A0A166D120_9EURY|nr:hypothetical protein [Methanobrevibacter cuticularis]KZX15090.1 hypothetical protein MBCUT_17350 [Methanobrevibacter cuticularis]